MDEKHAGVRTLGEEGLALEGEGRFEEAFAKYDEALPLLGEPHDPYGRALLAWLLAQRAEALANLGRIEEAVAAYGEVVTRLGDDSDLEPRLRLLEALANRSLLLRRLGRPEEALADLEEIVTRTDGESTPELATQGWMAQMQMGTVLGKLGREDEQREVMRAATDRLRERRPERAAPAAPPSGEELDAVMEFAARFAEDGDLAGVHERLDDAIVSGDVAAMESLAGRAEGMFRSAQAVVLAGMPAGGPELDQYLDRLAGAGPLDAWVGAALVDRGTKLAAAGRADDAAVFFDAVVTRFGERDTPELRRVVLVALLGKGAALAAADRGTEAASAYDELARRAEGDDDADVGRIAAVARAVRDALAS